MLGANRGLRRIFSLFLIGSMLWMSVAAQDLVPISSLTGGASVFVFRNSARAARRTTAYAKPVRTKAQQLDSVAKIKKQYDATAKDHRVAAAAVDPIKLPRNIKTLPAAQGSKLFAGVGEYYLAKNDLDKATEFFHDAVDLDGKNKAATDGLSEVLSTQGNNMLVADRADQAKGFFMEALKYNPSSAAAYFGLGEVYNQTDQIQPAIDAYEKALAADKDVTEIYVPLGILYYQTGDIAKADILLGKAIAASGNTPETQLFLGLVRFAQNRNDDALAAFQKADQTQPETQFYTGETLVRLKRTAEALPYYKKATDLKPSYFDAWFSLGEAQYELGHWDDATAAYKQAVRLRNTEWAAYAGLGDSLRQARKFDEATGYYRNAATFYTQQKDFNKETAAELYSKVGLSIGQQCDINMQLALMCNWDGAVKALQKAADISNNPIDQVNLGWAYFRWAHPDAEAHKLEAAKPNLELARDILTKAVAAGPPASDFALQNLASVQIDLGDYKNAIDSFSQLVKSKPDATFNKYALGVAYYKSGDAASGEKWLKEAVQSEPSNVSYLVALGDVYVNRKNGKDARRIADQLRTLSPQNATLLDVKIKAARL